MTSTLPSFCFAILALLFAPLAFSLELNVQNLDFSAAQVSVNTIKFDLETKKLGLFKSTVAGYVRSFKVQYDETPSGYQNVILKFKVRDLDTDLYARNDQMWNLCFEEKTYPEIILKISEPLTKIVVEKTIEAETTIRGTDRRFPVTYSSSIKDGKKIIEGSALVSLKGLGIKDPSIGIANVEDKAKIQFHFLLP